MPLTTPPIAVTVSVTFPERIVLVFQSPPDSEALRLLEAMVNTLAGLRAQGDKIMATLDQVAADVKEESTLIDGVSTMVDGLRQQVADALSGASLPPSVQAKVDQIFADAEANKGKLTAALAANTSAAGQPGTGGTGGAVPPADTGTGPS